MRPLSAGAIVNLLDAIDSLTIEFEPSMTLRDVEDFLYANLSDVCSCPSCRGLGRLGKDFYCNRCSGSGYVYSDE